MVKEHYHFDLYDKHIFERVVLKPPLKAPGIMPNEACFIYAAEGESHVYSATEEMHLHTEEAVVMKCGNYFNEWLKTKNSDSCEAIAVHFYPEVLKKIYDKELPAFFKEVEKVKPVCIEKVKASRLLKNYIDSLMYYFNNPELVSDELLKLKLKELILLLARTDNAESIQRLIASLFTPTEYSFKELIEANVYNNLTLEELALLHNTSLSSFKREFKKVYNTSPAKYFKQRKLQRAAKLISHTNERIGEIAFNCGFTEVAHFSRSFQEQFGCSPTQYRLTHTNN
ncbi:MAG: AraC family transcriptional regulator [Bacteroidota bacterium]